MSIKNSTFEMLLEWARRAPEPFSNGYTIGWLARDQAGYLEDRPRLELWEAQYVENVARARRMGISA